MQPDDNDIVINQYGPDLLGAVQNLFGWFSGQEGNTNDFYLFFIQFWQVFSIIAFLLSAVFIFGIVYAYIRFNQLSEIEMDQLLEAEVLWKELHGERAGGGEWQKIQSYLESSNPNDWKQAIIEADIKLDKTLTEAGYQGATIGEKLKSASPQNFTTLRDAWDAHMIRNKIAHQGSDFVLTQRIAQEAITKFGRVFAEFEVL